MKNIEQSEKFLKENLTKYFNMVSKSSELDKEKIAEIALDIILKEDKKDADLLGDFVFHTALRGSKKENINIPMIRISRSRITSTKTDLEYSYFVTLNDLFMTKYLANYNYCKSALNSKGDLLLVPSNIEGSAISNKKDKYKAVVTLANSISRRIIDSGYKYSDDYQAMELKLEPYPHFIIKSI